MVITIHNIHEFLDDEDGVHKAKETRANVVREIANCGKRMRFELDKNLLVMAPIAIIIIAFVVIEYVLLIRYFGG